MRRDIAFRPQTIASEHRSIAEGMGWVAFFLLLAKIAGAAKEMMVAYRYGISAEIDAYLYVFTLVSWPLAVWLGVLPVVLVPLSARLENHNELRDFRAELLGVTCIVALALFVVAWFSLPHILGLPWSGLRGDAEQAALTTARVLVLIIPIGLIARLSAWMLARGRHVGSLLEGVPPL